MWASDLECKKEKGPTDEGMAIDADILAAAAILSAAYNAAKAVEIAVREWELAKRYWKIAKNWLDYYKDWYAPVEDQEVQEALNLEHPTPRYDIARGRARTIAWLGFVGVVNQAVRCTSKYCTGLRNDMLIKLSSAQADSLAFADGLGYRNERAYLESREDVRFDKMMNTAKRGRDMIADNVSLAKATAGIYGDIYDQAWTGLKGAGQYLGYWTHRNETRYPTTYTEDSPKIYAKAQGVVPLAQDTTSTGEES